MTRVFVEVILRKGNSDDEGKATNKLSELNSEEIESAVVNIFNCLTYLLNHKNFVIEQINNSEADKTDLVYMINAAISTH